METKIKWHNIATQREENSFKCGVCEIEVASKLCTSCESLKLCEPCCAHHKRCAKFKDHTVLDIEGIESLFKPVDLRWKIMLEFEMSLTTKFHVFFFCSESPEVYRVKMSTLKSWHTRSLEKSLPRYPAILCESICRLQVKICFYQKGDSNDDLMVQQESKCPQHGRKWELYCETCDLRCCPECVPGHSEHRFVLLSDIIDTKLAKLEESLSEVQY